MLCPDVWNLGSKKKRQEPVPRPVNLKKRDAFIRKHQIISAVSIFIPSEKNITEATHKFAEELFKSYESYTISNIDFGDLIEYTFLHNFLRQGDLYVRSESKPHHNYLQIDTAKVSLYINKEQYQESGIEGKFIKELDQYAIDFDVSALGVTKTASRAMRLKNFISKAFSRSDRINLIWIPTDSTVCQSSAAKYFDRLGGTVELCSPKQNVVCRNFQYQPSNYIQLLDDISMFTLETEADGDHVIPDIENKFNALALSMHGFMCGQQVHETLEQLRQYLDRQDDTAMPYIHIWLEYAGTTAQRHCAYFMQKHNCDFIEL